MSNHLRSIERFYAHHPQADIDEIIRNEIIPYVRQFSALPESIQQESISRASKQSAEEYYKNLKNAWRAHNELAQKIDKFLQFALDWQHLTIKKEHIEEALKLLELAMKTEDEKRIYSAGVKVALDNNIERARKRYNLSTQDVYTASTLWQPAFWEVWLKKHVEWILAERSIHLPHSGSSEPTVVDVFHGSSPTTLEKRKIKGRLQNLRNMDSQELLKMHQRSVDLSRKLAFERVKGGYLALGRKDLHAVQDLLRYDSLTEYLFGINLWGLPDILLRKGLVNTYVSAGLLKDRGSILFYELKDFQIPQQKYHGAQK